MSDIKNPKEEITHKSSPDFLSYVGTSEEASESGSDVLLQNIHDKISADVYSTDVLQGLYSLARMYLSSGFYHEAEQLALGLLSIKEGQPVTLSSQTHSRNNPLHRTPSGEKSTGARLILAVLHFEKGNYSLAANHFRIASQINRFVIHGKLGLLACYCGLRDYARAEMLATELENSIGKNEITLSEEQSVFFKMYKTSITINGENKL
ncbi:MAG TPA: hypothetical protein PKA63_08655 [Oligoflexia bacterium]|nr:hypothetical protein [Oligoflexia bacterium]HMP48721.1 hypothetical protein [Oligoflexia bacterium]